MQIPPLIPGTDAVHENLLRAWCGPLRAEMTFQDLLVTTGMDSAAIAASLLSHPDWFRARYDRQRQATVYRPGSELLRRVAWCLLHPFAVDPAAVDPHATQPVRLRPTNIIPLRAAR